MPTSSLILSWISETLDSKASLYEHVVIPSILDVRLVDAPAGVTHEEGHAGFPHLLPSAVLALVLIARRSQPSLSLVDRASRILCTLEMFRRFRCVPIFL